MANTDIVSPYRLEIFETYGTQVAVVIVVLGGVYWLLQKWYGVSEPQQDVSTSKKSHFTFCESPGCVRCQKYHLRLSQSRGKLSKFLEDFGLDGVERISNVIKSPVPLFERADQEPNTLYISGLTAQRWWTNSMHFKSAVQLLIEHSEEIMIEYHNISMSTVNNEESGWSTNNTPTGTWSTFYLYNQGMKCLKNCDLCPKTTALIESLPQFMRNSIFGNALFSVIQPETEITEHFGPCNVRIRCHLGRCAAHSVKLN